MGNDLAPAIGNHISPASMAGVGCHERVRDLIAEYLPDPCRVVDLAAGEGAFSAVLRDLGHSVVAVDLDGKSWKAPEIELHLLDLDSEFADQLVGEDNKFDAVVEIGRAHV